MIFSTQHLREMLQRFEHENRGSGVDEYEIERFIKWIEERASADVDAARCEVEPNGELHDLRPGVVCITCWNSLAQALQQIRDTCGNADPLGGNRAVDIARRALGDR